MRPGDIIAAFNNMQKADGQHYFCVGIDHPLALKRTEDPDLRPDRWTIRTIIERVDRVGDLFAPAQTDAQVLPPV